MMQLFEQKPSWLKIKTQITPQYVSMNTLLSKACVHTICKEATCPNRIECWGEKTASFLIMGNICTRECAFCNVSKNKTPCALNPNEPDELATIVTRLDLKYLVVTSVTRDDLNDQGASHFARCIQAVRSQNPSTKIEALIPDFQGKTSCLETIIDACPDVLSHNIETVRNLYPTVRCGSDYDRSLNILSVAKQLCPNLLTKSGFMVGLGETMPEIQEVMNDLAHACVDFLTIGQYLQPSEHHLPVHRFVLPQEFEIYKHLAETKGFKGVVSSPFTRSSYQAYSLLKNVQNT